ncbi:MAG: hypothetical protein WD118_12110 [Phycisphaeraceae bacterium]
MRQHVRDCRPAARRADESARSCAACRRRFAPTALFTGALQAAQRRRASRREALAGRPTPDALVLCDGPPLLAERRSRRTARLARRYV